MNMSEPHLDPREYPQMDVYGVIGNPVAHSLSPVIHAQFAQQVQHAMHYGKLYAHTEYFADTVYEFFHRGGRGLNVTVPFKQAAFNLCHEHSERALAAGVVNILVQKMGQLYGDNSDGIGLVRDIESHSCTLAGRHILMIGAGGAVQGVVLPLIERKVQGIVIANRSLEKAQALVARFASIAQANQVGLQAQDLTAIENLQQPVDICINGTSSGLQGHSPLTQAQAKHLSQLFPKLQSGLVYDMVYGRETDFMAQMRTYGLPVTDGLGMLVEQAAQAFELWRNVPPQTLDTQGVLRLLRQRLP